MCEAFKQTKSNEMTILSGDPDERVHFCILRRQIQSTFVISKFKGLSEILRDTSSLTCQICRIEKKKSNNRI